MATAGRARRAAYDRFGGIRVMACAAALMGLCGGLPATAAAWAARRRACARGAGTARLEPAVALEEGRPGQRVDGDPGPIRTGDLPLRGRSIQLSYGAMQPGSLQATCPALQAFMFGRAWLRVAWPIGALCYHRRFSSSRPPPARDGAKQRNEIQSLHVFRAAQVPWPGRDQRWHVPGQREWSSATSGELITPVNPTTGEPIAQVRATTEAEYETVVARAQEAFKVWRTTPAPRRGEAVRLCGEALRRHKDALGSLVALEMGKSKPEGDGEVQEMIDIADFAVGQSRMLYGYTMHSERPGHRMYEQYHPLGLVGIISAFNFPVAVWSWNSFLAAICGDVHRKPSNKTPDRHRLAEDLQRRPARSRLPGHLLPDQRCTALSEKMVDDRRAADQLHRLDPGRSHRQREGRAPPRPLPGTRRQQRHHPGRNRRPEAGRAGHRSAPSAPPASAAPPPAA